MHYITLDLEWNQAYAQKALAVQRQLACRLRGEVIQIGAVKLDEKMKPIGSYQIIVKPKHFKKIHKHVSELTGITQEQMDSGTPLPEAEESFRKWCGNDFVFLTWGPDDIPMLKENLHIHGVEFSWLDRSYDLQLIFNKQTDGLSKQRSLEYAMEYFSLEQRLPAHDALNDAYFTALVASKLDVVKGIKEYDTSNSEHLESIVIGDADAGDDGYVTISEMLDDEIVTSHVCPICGKIMKKESKILHSKGQKYTVLYSCSQHGSMLLSLKLHKNFNGTYRARMTLDEANEEKIEKFNDDLAKSNVKRKVRGNKSVRRRKPKHNPAKEGAEVSL